MLTAEEVKERLTPEDIINIVCNDLGSCEPLNDAKGNLIFSTYACHGGDSMKLWYFIDSKSFMCFTHCGSMDIFSLVQHSKHFDTFQEAFQYVIAYFGLEDNIGFDNQVERIDDWDILQQIDDFDKYSQNEEEEQKVINENILEYFDPISAPVEWQKDGISPEVMRYYGIRIDSALSKIIIPHRNQAGQLIGIRGRTYDALELLKKQKYMPVFIEGTLYNHKLSKNLFGLYENQDTIRRIKKVMICESEKSVLQCATIYGVDNCWTVATCGSNISQDQVDLLLKLGVEEVILAYDREFETGKGEIPTVEYEKKLYKQIQPFLPYVNTYIIMDYQHLTKYKDSPTDRGREILEKLMHTKVYIPSIDSKDMKRSKK